MLLRSVYEAVSFPDNHLDQCLFRPTHIHRVRTQQEAASEIDSTFCGSDNCSPRDKIPINRLLLAEFDQPRYLIKIFWPSLSPKYFHSLARVNSRRLKSHCSSQDSTRGPDCEARAELCPDLIGSFHVCQASMSNGMTSDACSANASC